MMECLFRKWHWDAVICGRARETSCLTTIKEVDNLQILGKTNVLETNVYPFAKTDRGEELCQIVSEALEEMHEDGTLSELSQKWFDMDISEKPEGAEALQ